MDYNTKVTYAVILLGIVLLLLPIMMTIVYINAKKQINGKNNIDKKRSLHYALSRYKFHFLYSKDERALGTTYFCIFGFILLPIIIIVLIFLFSSF